MADNRRRWAEVAGGSPDRVAAYLPRGYRVAFPRGKYADGAYIVGVDDAGWTLDGYVLPRLASGLLFGREVTDPQRLADLDAALAAVDEMGGYDAV